jgi:hypothetical protein
MDSITDTSAFFISGQALFGAWPSQQQILQLSRWGVDLIVNLTLHNEKKTKPYTATCEVLHYPIPDREVPCNLAGFYACVVYVSRAVLENKKVYIHCKGGHGRACLLVACVLCFIHKITPEEAFVATSKFHSARLVHSSKPKKDSYWKTRGFPQTQEQRMCVKNAFQRYTIPEHSPFFTPNIWLSGAFDDYLLHSGLGSISGANGKELEEYRNALYFKKLPLLLRDAAVHGDVGDCEDQSHRRS